MIINVLPKGPYSAGVPRQLCQASMDSLFMALATRRVPRVMLLHSIIERSGRVTYVGTEKGKQLFFITVHASGTKKTGWKASDPPLRAFLQVEVQGFVRVTPQKLFSSSFVFDVVYRTVYAAKVNQHDSENGKTIRRMETIRSARIFPKK